jgi:quinol monooxygenase YgiN
MDQMCTVIAYFHAKPEKRQELEEILQAFVVQSRQEPGRIDYHLHQSDGDPNVFVF